MAQKPIMVVKLGSAVITNAQGAIDPAVPALLADELAGLREHYQLIIVSSGAVSCGKAFIKNYRGRLTERKAAAGIGNPILISLYAAEFKRHGIGIAQALCERHHFSRRHQFVQLRDTFISFWKNDIIPVVNENDLVSNVELKFSDNDELATLLAIAFNAELLILCTSAGGFYNAQKQVIPEVPQIDDTIMQLVDHSKSSIGLGGMLSKITFTKLATKLGIKVIMTGIGQPDSLLKALRGEAGTSFLPQKSSLSDRQRWLMSGSVTPGSLRLDRGAAEAVAGRKSLLAVGISSVEGGFVKGEVVQLKDEQGMLLGVGKTRMDSGAIAAARQSKGSIVAHVDDIVLFYD